MDGGPKLVWLMAQNESNLITDAGCSFSVIALFEVFKDICGGVIDQHRRHVVVPGRGPGSMRIINVLLHASSCSDAKRQSVEFPGDRS